MSTTFWRLTKLAYFKTIFAPLKRNLSLLDGGEAFESRLEGLNFDSTVATLGQYSQFENVAISVKRVFKRGEVIVQMVGPGGKQNISLSLFGSSLFFCLKFSSRSYNFLICFVNYRYKLVIFL